MRLTRSLLTIVGALLWAGPACAQRPSVPDPLMPGPPPQQRERGPWPLMSQMGGGPGDMRGGPPGQLASHLLAHVAELKLSDQQVTKLAAVARRTDEGHRAMRTTLDSLARLASPPAPGIPPRAPNAMRAAMERAREMERGDVRDALAVLTIEQQADAWMMRGQMGGPRGSARRRGGAPR